MPSRFGVNGLIAFIIVAAAVFGLAKLIEIIKLFKMKLKNSKGMTEKYRVTLK
jgi:hypothetical protein